MATTWMASDTPRPRVVVLIYLFFSFLFSRSLKTDVVRDRLLSFLGLNALVKDIRKHRDEVGELRHSCFFPEGSRAGVVSAARGERGVSAVFFSFLIYKQVHWFTAGARRAGRREGVGRLPGTIRGVIFARVHILAGRRERGDRGGAEERDRERMRESERERGGERRVHECCICLSTLFVLFRVAPLD